MKPNPGRTEKTKYHSKKAFTLIEIMISMGVLSILAGIAAQTFVAILDSRDVALKRLEVNENARTVLDFISADIRTAYLTPDSIKPVNPRNIQEGTPRFRFAGIHRDISTEDEPGIPGAGIDDDGDGLIDEEVLDGVGGDYPGGAVTSLKSGRAQEDPGCTRVDDEGNILFNDASCVDEDIGLIPSDVLHFVSAVENSGQTILQEISYGLNPEGTRLVRRAQVLSLDGGSRARVELIDFGQFVDNATRKRLVPQAPAIGAPVSRSAVRASVQNWNDGSKFGQLQARSSNFTNQNPAKLFQVLAYDIRGLRFRYWYYDYNRGGWRFTREWDSARETALLTPGENLFNQPALNSGIEGRNRMGFENIIVNEPEDMYPRIGGMDFLVRSPRQLTSSNEFTESLQSIAKQTDGLPNMVEITVYAQDRERTLNPRAFTTRVFVPNNYRSLGI